MLLFLWAALQCARGDDIDRLIAELKSTSNERRGIATLALKAYGSAPLRRLEAAKANPELIDACRGITPEMRAVLIELDKIELKLPSSKANLEEILEASREASGLNCLIDVHSKRVDSERKIDFETDHPMVGEALRKICSELEIGFQVGGSGRYVFITPYAADPPPAMAPIRLDSDAARRTARAHVAHLSSDDPNERDEAGLVLRRLGFAAEPVLWETLDSNDAHARAMAADLLACLYRPRTDVTLRPFERRIRETRIALDFADTPLPNVLDRVRKDTGLNFALDGESLGTPEEQWITIKISGVPVHDALRLMLEPKQIYFADLDGLIVVTRRQVRERSRRNGPFWMEAATAARIERLISAVGKSEEAEKELVELGEPALGPLAEAACVFDAGRAARCRALRHRIIDTQKLWILDEPSGADLQKLTDAQSKILDATVDVEAAGTSLAEVLKHLGIKASVKLEKEVCLTAKAISTATLLKAVTRTGDLDFYFDGDTLVVDSAANVRSVLEK